jgi:hypothetical protein
MTQGDSLIRRRKHLDSRPYLIKMVAARTEFSVGFTFIKYFFKGIISFRSSLLQSSSLIWRSIELTFGAVILFIKSRYQLLSKFINEKL